MQKPFRLLALLLLITLVVLTWYTLFSTEPGVSRIGDYKNEVSHPQSRFPRKSTISRRHGINKGQSASQRAYLEIQAIIDSAQVRQKSEGDEPLKWIKIYWQDRNKIEKLTESLSSHHAGLLFLNYHNHQTGSLYYMTASVRSAAFLSLQHMAKMDIEQTLSFLEKNNIQITHGIVEDSLARGWVENDSKAAAQWLAERNFKASQSRSTELHSDEWDAGRDVFASYASIDFDGAFSLAMSLTSSPQRKTVLRGVISQIKGAEQCERFIQESYPQLIETDPDEKYNLIWMVTKGWISENPDAAIAWNMEQTGRPEEDSIRYEPTALSGF